MVPTGRKEQNICGYEPHFAIRKFTRILMLPTEESIENVTLLFIENYCFNDKFIAHSKSFIHIVFLTP